MLRKLSITVAFSIFPLHPDWIDWTILSPLISLIFDDEKISSATKLFARSDVPHIDGQ